MYGSILIVAMLTMTMLCVSVVSVASAATEDGVSLGPIENSGDGVPGNNYFDQPAPGMGPAPNAGSGEQDGSGF